MANSAFDKFAITSADFNSGDITTGFFDDTGPATTLRIHYFKVGKLYFGFNATQLSNGQATPTVGGNNSTEYNDSVSRICTQLSITLDTAYRNNGTAMYGTNTDMHWDGVSSWASNNGGGTTYALKAILST